MELRAYLSGASATPPTAPSTPSIGYPTSGSPGTIPASEPGPYWFHQVSEELRNLLTSAGVTPSQSVLTQVKTALDTLYGNRSGHTYTSTDWAWLDKQQGLIIQWGTTPSINSGSNTTITFPTAFTGAPLAAGTSIIGGIPNQCYTASTNIGAGATSTQMVVSAYSTSGAAAQFCWWAIGK